MFLVYRPDGQEEQRWRYDPRKLKSVEAEGIEKRTGWPFDQFTAQLQQGSMLARRALLWTLLRRQHHVLRFEDVDFAVGEVELQYDKTELAELREKALTMPFESEALRSAAIIEIDRMMEDAPEAEGKAN